MPYEESLAKKFLETHSDVPTMPSDAMMMLGSDIIPLLHFWGRPTKPS